MFRVTTNKLSKWSFKSGRTFTAKTHNTNKTKHIEVPSSADIVIIGGGSAGCNALYQLGKRGVNAVLLDKSKLISGTTWHTAGLVWSLRGVCDVEMELLKVSRFVYTSLQEETGVNPGYINNGGVYIAHSPERVTEYERLVTGCKSFGIDAYMLEPAEAKKKFPLVDDKAFAAAVHCTSDGTIDPVMMVNALTKSATRNGCKVTSIGPFLTPHRIRCRSRQVLRLLIEDDLSNESLPFSTSKLVRIEGELVHVFRLSFVGELGFELHVPRSSCDKVYRALMECGKKYDMKLAGYRALYSLSCEKGYHLWSADLRPTDNPIEAGLGFTCRDNGEYLGKVSIEQYRQNGIKKRLVHLHVDNDIPLWGMESVYRNNQLVGYLRRAERGYTLKSSIGQAYIRAPNGQNITKEFLETGTYQIEAMRKRYPAKMYLHSPFDPQNKRLQGMYVM